MWSTIFAFLAVAMIAILVVSLAQPKWFANDGNSEIPTRSELAMGGVFLILLFAGLAALLARENHSQEAKQPITKRAETEPHKIADPWIKPDTIVQFPKGEIACLSSDDLLETFLLGATGRGTKLNAYFQDQDGNGPRCLMLPPNRKFKVIDSEAGDVAKLPDALLLEVVGEDVQAADEGAFVMVVDRSMAKIVK